MSSLPPLLVTFFHKSTPSLNLLFKLSQHPKRRDDIQL
jgi:hypothetical protein